MAPGRLAFNAAFVATAKGAARFRSLIGPGPVGSLFAQVISGTIETEDFDLNPYFNSTGGNQSKTYRYDVDVDIKSVVGGCAVAKMASGRGSIVVEAECHYSATINAGGVRPEGTLSLTQRRASLLEALPFPAVPETGMMRVVAAGAVHLYTGVPKIRLDIGSSGDASVC